MPRARSSSSKNNSTANLGFESRGRGIWLVAELHVQFAESAKLEQAIKANMEGLGYGG